ncbi:MAG: hypothetical protein OEZ65_09915 [Gemmatimonadota bacterium]|nr:hypothetical protein [Gemmatimonadota bacterium]MDH5759893.1 hypothetical protein [Gemmatimonadota bacterium]
MTSILDHFWAVCIAVTCANAVVWWRRGEEFRQRDPSLEYGYRRLVRGLLAWGNLPWVVMGIGMASGNVDSLFRYFDIRGGGPFVLAFYASMFVIWIAGFAWIFWGGGAMALVRHPGLSNFPMDDPRVVKVLWAMSVISGVIFVAMVTLVDIRELVR